MESPLLRHQEVNDNGYVDAFAINEESMEEIAATADDNDDDDNEDGNNEDDDILKNTVAAVQSPGTKSSYAGHIARFGDWLFKNRDLEGY